MSRFSKRLLLIDDDRELAELLKEFLDRHGFALEAVHTGEDALLKLKTETYDLIILDVMLPGIDGFGVLGQLRNRSSTPVMMLTARGEDIDRIIGLELGADDYLAKPFNPRELVARARAILRRSEPHAAPDAPEAQDTKLVVGDVEMDLRAREVRCAGRAIRLTSAEFDLLRTLLRSVGQVLDRTDLFKSVLGREPDPNDRSIDIHVSHLRSKLGRPHSGVERIKSVRGVGYVYTLAEGEPTG